MNEGQKTGAYWVAAAVMLAVGLVVAWPTSTREDVTIAAGKPLFEEFTDPLAASSLKIVTFDEEQGQVDTFEVRRDRETGEWTIPSRSGYPADAVEQMRDAANALVGLQILDEQTRSVEDHEALGVVEPALEDLEVGDVGVGRLVSFKDESQKTLASLIIGKPVKDEEGKVYVRRPGQDPVYVVKLNESALSTNFQNWIEEDLLQLSSIDIEDLSIKDYSASIELRGGVSLDRNYSVDLTMDGSQWELQQLLEHPSDNPLADPVPVEVGEDEQLNTDRLNDVKNALDDLKIVDVVRKPDGMSANLRAEQALVSDNEAVASLASRGFFPVSLGSGRESEVLSANGELSVTLNDGVQYVLRFGNVSGLSEESEEEEEDASGTGVNRYLLVTAKVDESKFPPPDLQPVPQSVEELEALLGETPEASDTPPEEDASDAASNDAASTQEDSDLESDDGPAEASLTDQPSMDESESVSEPDAGSESGQEPSEQSSTTENPATTEEQSEPTGDETNAEASTDPANSDSGDSQEADSSQSADTDSEKTTSDDSSSTVEEVEVSGSGTATGEGQGDAEQASSETVDAETTPESDIQPASADVETPDEILAAKKPTTEESTTEESTAEESVAEESASPDDSTSDDGGLSFSELSPDEKQERLEAEQEKILKENTRRLDARKDELEKAERRVRELNDRFADWYYVIPESTYRDLRLSREELFLSAEEAAADTQPSPPMNLPNFGNPGFGGAN